MTFADEKTEPAEDTLVTRVLNLERSLGRAMDRIDSLERRMRRVLGDEPKRLEVGPARD